MKSESGHRYQNTSQKYEVLKPVDLNWTSHESKDIMLGKHKANPSAKSKVTLFSYPS